MVNVADALAGMNGLDSDGRQVPLAVAWRDCPVVVVFVRHFG